LYYFLFSKRGRLGEEEAMRHCWKKRRSRVEMVAEMNPENYNKMHNKKEKRIMERATAEHCLLDTKYQYTKWTLDVWIEVVARDRIRAVMEIMCAAS
jgi:hypothetical protein